MGVVLVTGGTRGLGEAIVREFARGGYDVVINYCNSKKRAKQLKEELSLEYGVMIDMIRADVSKEDDVITMVDMIEEKFGKLDVIVNNAGIAIDSDFVDKSASAFKKILDVNLIGPFLVSKYASRIMDEGVIVNIGSTNGIDTNYVYSMDYDASKAALHMLTKDLAIALGPKIRVNAVAPGWIDTDTIREDLDLAYRKQEEAKIILGRFARPMEIAKVVFFLASREASYIVGSVICVDGGKR